MKVSIVCEKKKLIFYFSSNSDVASRWQRCIESLLEEWASVLKVSIGGNLRLILFMCQVMFKVVTASPVTEDGIRLTCFTRAVTSRLFLRIVASIISARSRDLTSLKLILDIVEARLSCIESWLVHVV